MSAIIISYDQVADAFRSQKLLVNS